MIKIIGKVDKLNTYNRFGDNISLFILRRTSSDNKEYNITTKPVVSVLICSLLHFFLSSCQIHQNLPFLSLSLSLYIYIYIDKNKQKLLQYCC